MAMPSHVLALALTVAALLGILIGWGQIAALWLHLRGPRAIPLARPPISILKPLCGLDDRLAGNLLSFAALPYPDYEVLLGVRSRTDPAYPLAWMAARRWPQRFRVIVQEGEVGLNPKVNQLVTLARHARHELLVISDSNTRVEPEYLDEIAAHLGDPTVGLVTHPLAGDGEREAGARLGAIADNLHLTGAITPAVVTAKLVCRKDYVVGKSMAMRRADIDALGGFASVKDVLAEDFVLGRAVVARLGKRVVLGRSVVTCVSVRRPLDGFFRRYARWNIMQHQCAGLPAYVGLLLENPGALAALAVLVDPSVPSLTFAATCCASRMATDAIAGWLLRARSFSLQALLAGGAKDLLCGAAWIYGLVSHSIEWRSNRLVVLSGSRLRIASSGGRLRLPELIAGGNGTRSGSRIKKHTSWGKARLARVGAAR